MKALHASISIDPPAERVWQLVSDFAQYSALEPVHRARGGRAARGRAPGLTIVAPGMKPVSFRPRVLDVEPGRLIRWKSAFKPPGLFDGRHALSIDLLDAGRSRFTTREDVSGPLLPFAGKVMTASQRGFEFMAQALKVRAEA